MIHLSFSVSKPSGQKQPSTHTVVDTTSSPVTQVGGLDGPQSEYCWSAGQLTSVCGTTGEKGLRREREGKEGTEEKKYSRGMNIKRVKGIVNMQRKQD